MKQKIVTLVLVLMAMVGGVIFGFRNHGEEVPREKLIAQIIYTGLERWHYTGKSMDDDFSRKAFDEFIEYIDYSKRFLLKGDVDELSRKYREKIDDLMEAGNIEVVTLASEILRKRIKQVEGFYRDLLAGPFDFTVDEYLERDPEKRDYCKDEAELREHWRKSLKYWALSRYMSYLGSEEKTKEKSKKELEEDSRQAVLKDFKSFFERILKSDEDDSLSSYLNSLVQVYDPHTTYFLPVDKENFDMQMSGAFEGIGALLREEDGYVKVSSIVPGGPSWRQKELEAGDAILKVGQGDEEPVDIIGMRTVDAVKLIRGKKGTIVRLTVKKADDRVMVISIVRDVVVLEETFAKSAVVVHKASGKRFGYIFLPSFYTDFSRDNGRSSSGDVKIELEKLKAQNVEGVILDLRSNTGGALRDAVAMSGLFVPKGPMVRVKDKEGETRSLDDPDPGVTYDGPLVVMVNRLSASASEILAGALQDYNRAVIVGGEHSYGKGTVQAMINLDNMVFRSKARDKYKAFGSMTITIQKFYRISGKSIQLRGVAPDVVLPDRHEFGDIGERHLDYALEWDSIGAAEYDKWRPESPMTPELLAKSKARVQKDPAFRKLEDYIAKVKSMRDDTRYSLKLSEMQKRQKMIREEREKLEETENGVTRIDVVLPEGMEPLAKADKKADKKTDTKSGTKKTTDTDKDKKKPESLDDIARERLEAWFKDIKADILIGESVDILNDLSETASTAKVKG